ncbi:MAG: hypothetical protein AAF616_09580 [Bacteroidota bacterium]
MDQMNIDRLFQNKLAGREVAPSKAAWSSVAKQLPKKRKPPIYWIAASIALFLLVAFSLLLQKTAPSVGIASSEIDHPVLRSSGILSPPRAVKARKRSVGVEQQTGSLATLTVVHSEKTKRVGEVTKDRPQSPENQQLTSPLPVIQESMVAVAEDEIENGSFSNQEEVMAVNKMATVKITYIASETKTDKAAKVNSDSVGVFKKFIALSDKLEPGKMLADIKSAKDNLLNGGFSSNRGKPAMAP